MEINLEELREAARLLHEMALDAEKVLPVLQYAEKNQSGVIPTTADHLVKAGEAAKILGVSKTSISNFVRAGLLIPVYVDSERRKFWLSDIMALPKKTPWSVKDSGDKRGRRKKI